MEDIIGLNSYAQFGSGSGAASQGDVDELVKALSAGSITGRETTGSTTASGSPLKVESLESTLKILTNTERDVPVWKTIPKLAAFNTVEEYNQLVNYGMDGGAFTNEGELPVSADTVYRRQAQLVKFMGTTREVTHPMQLVNTMVGNIIQRETQNGTLWIMRQIERALAFGNSDIVPQEFNGFYKQHYDGVGLTPDQYHTESEVVIDCRGQILQDKYVEAATAGVNQNFGFADKLIAPPGVFSNYVKQFHNRKLIQPNTQQVMAGVMGQKVVKIVTQFGDIDLVDDKFFRKNPPRLTTAGSTAGNAPTAPIADVTTPIAATTDATNQFAGFLGDYFYAVAAKNRYGESALTLLNASSALFTVATGKSVDLKFASGGGTYPATGYVIYRSKANPTTAANATPLYPIIEVSVANLGTGFEGAGAGVVRDKNYRIAGTEEALLVEYDTEVLAFKQLAPLMKMDLATIAPSTRFMILLYGTPILYAPKKVARIINIGDVFPT